MKTFEKDLNPIYTRIDEINDFSTIQPQSNTEKEEYPHLQTVTNISAKTSHKMIHRLHELERDLENQIKLIEMETDLDARIDAVGIYNKILNQIEECVERINIELLKLDSPYFGKIVFETKIGAEKRKLPVYSGKFALMEKKHSNH
jgi:protein subunit release factor A